MQFEECWPRYLRAHSRPLTRSLHVAGPIAATSLVVGGMLARKPWLSFAGLAAGYDFLMAWHVLRGTIDVEIAKNGSPYHK